jgi:hypothetical protein
VSDVRPLKIQIRDMQTGEIREQNISRKHMRLIRNAVKAANGVKSLATIFDWPLK